MNLFWVRSGFQSGVYNMALDEALLEWVRVQEQSSLVVRTYQWECPTLSLGVNQAVKDVQALLRLYGAQSSAEAPIESIVRRPTGGRAILHGADISFSFITNDTVILRKSLNDSYAVLSGLIQETVQALGVKTQQSTETQGREYLRSPVCFQTHTPSDLLAEDGQKICGSAQLRRLGGILQHGAAFLEPYGIAEEQFSAQLFETVQSRSPLGHTDMDAWKARESRSPLESEIQPFPMNEITEIRQRLEADYLKESGAIWANAPVTNGSHLAPASC